MPCLKYYLTRNFITIQSKEGYTQPDIECLYNTVVWDMHGTALIWPRSVFTKSKTITLEEKKPVLTRHTALYFGSVY